MAIRKLNAELVYKDENEHGEPEYGNRITFAVNSEDEKPSGELTNGSVCIEVDTGKVFLWDEEQNYWIEQFSLQGGGNPNSVQVITGTLANPFGDVNLTELENAINNSNASFIMELDLSILGISNPVKIASSPIQRTSYLAASALYINDNGELTDALYGSWTLTAGNELHSAWAEYGGAITDMAEYASQIPTTLTIYWHPMS